MASHKHLKRVCHDFGNSFISLMNHIDDNYFMSHLLNQTRKTNLSKLTVDIIKNIAEPTELINEKMKSSIDYWNEWFPILVESSGSSIKFVSSATITIEFDLRTTRPFELDPNNLENPFTCETIIIDDRNKTYKYLNEGWWCI